MRRPRGPLNECVVLAAEREAVGLRSTDFRNGIGVRQIVEHVERAAIGPAVEIRQRAFEVGDDAFLDAQLTELDEASFGRRRRLE